MLHSEFIPAAVKDSRAVMVMLHGLGDSIEGYRWLPEAMNLPWLNYLLVNAPDEYYGGYSWFNLDDQKPGVVRSRKLLFALLDDLRAKYGERDLEEIFVKVVAPHYVPAAEDH